MKLENVGQTYIRLECLYMEAVFHDNTQKALYISHDTLNSIFSPFMISGLHYFIDLHFLTVLLYLKFEH